MSFSIVFAALATLAFAAPGPSTEGEGLERRQRSCTINGPGKLRRPLTNNSTGLQLWKLPRPRESLHVSWLFFTDLSRQKKQKKNPPVARPAQRAAAVSQLLPLFA
ncbi:hypothetical protein CSHISOI_05833 [Colletotrichum shisoi]|uniref:Uncharacterized protein n=1 Tax=Colletotrichum shisoi TaxID=2078593 RepID=A0A5Q4BTG8_9PEZI|nr:hypothetical protein CSHISOI_05833 [Colletotrichum shisoi]